MMTLFDILEGKEDKKGDKKAKTKDKGAVKSRKSRARIFDTIKDALDKGFVGQIFSTKGSDRP